MPGMDGYETAGLIREREQTSRNSDHLPVGGKQGNRTSDARLLDGRGRLCVQAGRSPDPEIEGCRVRRPVQHADPGGRDQPRRAGAARGEFPGGVGKIQIERELQATRERETAIIQSLPMLLYIESSSAKPRRPDFISGDMEAMTGFELRRSTSRSSYLGATASSRRP